jgi:zinc protease
MTRFLLRASRRPDGAACHRSLTATGLVAAALVLSACQTASVSSASSAVPVARQATTTATSSVAVASTPSARSVSPGGVVEQVLPNGLKVLVKPDNRAPTVAHMVWYKAGSIDEVNGRTGVAHVLEHMMFKGTRSIGPGEFSRRVAAMGGRENAFTSRDYTGYFQQVHKSKLGDVMALEADRMGNLQLTKEEFDKEIRVVMEERRLRTEDKATALLYEQLMASVFTANPYRQPVVGWMSDLEAMTVDDARAWYDAWYTPSNAVLVVAGDVDPDAVIALAESTYGTWPARAVPPRKPQTEPVQKGLRRIEVKAPADNPYVALAFRVPGLSSIDTDREAFALEVLSSVLDSGDSSRLTRHIVRGSRVANQAGAGYNLVQRGPALFTLDGTPADGRTTADVERALRAEIARIAAEGVPQAELERVKVQYVAQRVYKRDSVFGQAMEIAGLTMVGLSSGDADRILTKVRAVTSDEVKAVAAKYFGDDALTVATLLPQPIAPGSVRRSAPPAGARH